MLSMKILTYTHPMSLENPNSNKYSKTPFDGVKFEVPTPTFNPANVPVPKFDENTSRSNEKAKVEKSMLEAVRDRLGLAKKESPPVTEITKLPELKSVEVEPRRGRQILSGPVSAEPELTPREIVEKELKEQEKTARENQRTEFF
jgi:hypothetical protein